MSVPARETEKPRTRRVKRKNVQAGDGWTVVTHASSGEGVALDGVRARGTVQGLTVEMLMHDLRQRRERWRDTECARGLEGAMGQRSWDVGEAVCIGIGSFSLDWEHRHRAMWQLVMLLEVIRFISKPELTIKVYAQEPAFTPLDLDFLAALDIEVTISHIEIHITDKTFVFAPFVDWYILLPTFLRDKEPELYIGNEILDEYDIYASSEDKKVVLAESNAVGQKLLKGRQSRRVPEFALHAHALNGLVTYWKIDRDADIPH
ncbi:hypothetical protein EJ04DRAFT_438379 [Polyplosphaeria fusca]|uniref:SRR1-like domain-containing protein n=1 Tax=Polyplosphaeria fusca TaxID=682080 RepID=A0A9P4V2X7_9PLEO|nr:hypothetical protein EJ04DRAFT_438379 [Polyplosphaeria fusca]